MRQPAMQGLGCDTCFKGRGSCTYGGIVYATCAGRVVFFLTRDTSIHNIICRYRYLYKLNIPFEGWTWREECNVHILSIPWCHCGYHPSCVPLFGPRICRPGAPLFVVVNTARTTLCLIEPTKILSRFYSRQLVCLRIESITQRSMRHPTVDPVILREVRPRVRHWRKKAGMRDNGEGYMVYRVYPAYAVDRCMHEGTVYMCLMMHDQRGSYIGYQVLYSSMGGPGAPHLCPTIWYRCFYPRTSMCLDRSDTLRPMSHPSNGHIWEYETCRRGPDRSTYIRPMLVYNP
jgi:hypothetical protein